MQEEDGRRRFLSTGVRICGGATQSLEELTTGDNFQLLVPFVQFREFWLIVFGFGTHMSMSACMDVHTRT